MRECYFFSASCYETTLHNREFVKAVESWQPENGYLLVCSKMWSDVIMVLCRGEHRKQEKVIGEQKQKDVCTTSKCEINYGVDLTERDMIVAETHQLANFDVCAVAGNISPSCQVVCSCYFCLALLLPFAIELPSRKTNQKCGCNKLQLPLPDNWIPDSGLIYLC